MTSQLNTSANGIFILKRLLRKLKISVTQTTIEERLLNHPDYPSLLAIKDVLNWLDIENKVLLVDETRSIFELLDCPFIVNLKDDTTRFLLVEKIEEQYITVSDEKGQNKRLSFKDFHQLFGGIIVYAEKTAISGEEDYRKKRNREWLLRLRIPFLIAVIVITLSLALFQKQESYLFYSLLLVKIIGISTCILLLTYDLTPWNPVAQRICKLANPNGCRKVLKSKAAKLTDWLTWSDVGLVYFVGSFLFLLISPNSWEILFILTVVALPFTIFSISYQIKIKSLCVLCCIIVMLLWVESIVLFFGYSEFDSNALHIEPLDFFLVAVCFIIPTSLWTVLKPLIKSANNERLLTNRLRGFKSNRIIFNALLTSTTRYQMPFDLNPIVLGNPNARVTITIISNPFCSPCKLVHSYFEKWLNEDGGIKVCVFFISSDDQFSDKTLFASNILKINLEMGQTSVRNVLNSWFDGEFKSLEGWLKHHDMGSSPEFLKILEKQRNWFNELDVTFTPTILINGYKTPWQYSIDEIRYLLT